MPRKATASSGEETPAPRRSSRIKEQPQKPEATAKKPAKPKVKKADKEGADKEEKPKSARATKRKAPEEPNGAEEPATKKVCTFPVAPLHKFLDIAAFVD